MIINLFLKTNLNNKFRNQYHKEIIMNVILNKFKNFFNCNFLYIRTNKILEC